jgi:omega-6 fatty acid desaturase (delta-12 desaturase)
MSRIDSETCERPQQAEWRAIVKRYQVPSNGVAAWQIGSTVSAYAATWVAMYLTLGWSWWLTIGLAVLAAGLMVRTFIIFHDCGHGSFFSSTRANDLCGIVTGLLTWTPYFHWRWQHAVHHATSGDLDRRGMGDLWTMTVAEYLAAPRWQRIAYRLARNPIVLFVLAPVYLFVVHNRFASSKAGSRERKSVWWTNAALAALTVSLASLFGVVPYLVIQLTILVVAGGAGIWLFYVQHQFEGVRWDRTEEWDYALAALEGSSYYQLPRVLQWFTGNIGFHHIHHLSSRIPNYRLERCHYSEPLFQRVKAVTLASSAKSLWLRLWDESERMLVGWSHLRRVRARANAESQAARHDSMN